MRFRINYAIKGHLAFLSHLEVMRLWQRALLRSHLPVSWSHGFNPRPKISLGPAKGVGFEGLSEYLDVEFKSYLSGEQVQNDLNRVLPLEMQIIKSRELPAGSKLLEAAINEALYRVTFLKGVPGDLEQGVKAFLAREEIIFMRRRPKKDKELNIRPYVYSLDIKDESLFMSLKLGPEGSVRPDEILTVLGCWDIMGDIKIERLGLYIKEGVRRHQP